MLGLRLGLDFKPSQTKDLKIGVSCKAEGELKSDVLSHQHGRLSNHNHSIMPLCHQGDNTQSGNKKLLK